MNSSWKYYPGEEVAAASLSNFIHWRKPYDASNHLGELLLIVVKIFPQTIQMILRNSKRLICRNLEGDLYGSMILLPDRPSSIHLLNFDHAAGLSSGFHRSIHHSLALAVLSAYCSLICEIIARHVEGDKSWIQDRSPFLYLIK